MCEFLAELCELLRWGPQVTSRAGQTCGTPLVRRCPAPDAAWAAGLRPPRLRMEPHAPLLLSHPDTQPARQICPPLPPPRLPPGSATSPCAPRWPFRMTIQTKPGLPLCPAPNVQSPFPSDKIKTPDPRRAPRGSEGLPAARTSRGAHPRPRPPPRVAGAPAASPVPPTPPPPVGPPARAVPCPRSPVSSPRSPAWPSTWRGPRTFRRDPQTPPPQTPGSSSSAPGCGALHCCDSVPTREAKRRGLTNAGPSDRRRLGSPEHEGRGGRRGRTSSQIPAQRLLRAGGVSMGTDGHGVSFWGDENVLKWDRVLYTGDLYGP